MIIRKFLSMHACALWLIIFFLIPLRFSYVGNLDRRCSELFIKDIFSKCGKVVRCKMINAVSSFIVVRRIRMDEFASKPRHLLTLELIYWGLTLFIYL